MNQILNGASKPISEIKLLLVQQRWSPHIHWLYVAPDIKTVDRAHTEKMKLL